MVGIGIWGMRKTHSLNDFFLGGRSIGQWISALAYGTSYFSAVRSSALPPPGNG